MADYQLSYTGDQVNTAIGQIINKNITGTLTIETLDLTNSLAITQGGTGATTAAEARKAILENKALSIAEGGTGKTTAAEALEALGGTSLTKIWENASPTSSFSAQTLTINTLSNYDWYVIIYKFYATLDYALAEFGVVGNGTIINMVDSGSIYRRNVDCSANNLTISEINGIKVNSAANISDNKYLIPAMIYGVKGVI